MIAIAFPQVRRVMPWLVLGLLAISCLLGQGTAPNAGLIYLQTIPIPNWATSGANQANFDLFTFDPVSSVMYVADRVNHSVTAIDTHTNGVIGVIPVPGAPGTNGVLVIPDLQQLVVTDGKTNVFVYDLRVPGMGPDQYTLPNIGGNTDALDYDPLNGTVYVINGTAPSYMSGIDLVHKTIASQLKLPGAPELNRFNVNDGLIYQVITAFDDNKNNSGVVAFDPVSNTIKATYLTPNCMGHGIDIDPVTNVAVVGCGTNQAQVMLDLSNGTILKTFPDVTGTDLLTFSPATRRFYIGASGNQSTTTGCPQDTTKAFPIIGVIDAQGSRASGVGRLVGVQCTGRGSKLGVDTNQNFLYVGARQFPVDPTDPNKGQAGLLVFYDPAAPQPVTTQTRASLAAMGGGASLGTVQIRPAGRRGLRATVITPAISGSSARLTITTTAGYEVMPCGVDPGTKTAYCDGPLVGDPLIGGVALLGVDGSPVARGVVQ